MQKLYKEDYLKPYATKSVNSLGRIYKETENKFRSPFQRDRDRIIHSSSFRRLKHKTQVFVNTEVITTEHDSPILWKFLKFQEPYLDH